MTAFTSRDVNRLRRIIADFDEVATGHVPPSELTLVGQRMIDDLAGLARENPDDLEIATIMAHLPKGPIPDLPTTPRDAIRLDDMELERQKELGGMRLYAPRGEEAPRRIPRRRFHTRIAIRQ